MTDDVIFAPGQRLPRAFFARPPVEVARALLGMRLVRVWQGERLSGRIVEVEAYAGQEDPASHAFRGPTPRNQVMFGPPGFAYVYFIYGMHHCLNVVTGETGKASAVLLRALEPQEGIEQMRALCGRPGRELTSGPGRLTRALRIGRECNGVDLCLSDVLFIEAGEAVLDGQVEATPRVGVRGDDWARTVLWRFVERGNPYRSR